MGERLNVPIEYSKSLLITNEMLSNNCNSGKTSYKLISTVHHESEHVHYGHYTTHAICGEDKLWIKFDDEKRSILSEEDLFSVKHKKSIVMLLYELQSQDNVKPKTSNFIDITDRLSYKNGIAIHGITTDLLPVKEIE